MATFRYTAKDINSKKFHGKVEANSREELVTLLRSDNLYLLKCKEYNEEGNHYKIKLKELAELCRQVGTMISSGISLIMAMNIMTKRETNPKLEKIYKDVYIKLQQGFTLSNALVAQGRAFPNLMINMIHSSESTGMMDKTLLKLADQYDKDSKINAKVKSAMFYPIILIVVTVGVVMLVFTMILPNFLTLFEGMDMPFITQVMFAISDAIINYGHWILIVILILIAGISYLLRVDKVRLQFDKFKLSIPKVGSLLKIIYTARFARSMSSLYSSGVSMINSLNLAKTTVNNAYIESQFDDVVHSVRDGTNLSTAISEVHGFDAKLPNAIYVGEESGKLDDMLQRIADDFDFESEMAIEKLVTLLQPVMIIILGVLICMVVVSVILPIYSMYGNVSGKG
ncbi:type II secretion system F family protein [Candidatus Stoquefichus sp. SB1]|uniref:type II secretion system F family protein n=1 Tax=Candidatus Stoquefichus sp. SB1 TaxID=1658109 RepID=UPI00067EFA49|nr:type II secretion system F family protein [Candidatus Stoquefichus sp. SB1]